jgi:2-(1,2-epoxy-1,2-dihydrophenyl)acetyl-CoA isomerase
MTSFCSFTTLKCDLDSDGVLLVLLNRPEKMNSLDETMVGELQSAMTTASSDSDVRCVVITGEGRAFSAGRDISSAQPDEDAYDIIANHVNPMLATIYHCPKPTIAAVNGPAMGVGLGIALACDIVLAADNARLSSPFARLGVALDSGGHYFLPRLVGYHRAMEMVFTSDIIRGKQAAAWGLVNHSVPGTRLRDRSLELAGRIARGPVNAFMAEKAFMRRAATMSYDEVCAAEAKLQDSLMGSPEYDEGLAAFTSKRAPDFSRIPLRAEPDGAAR